MKPQRLSLNHFSRVAKAAGDDAPALKARVKSGGAEFFKLGRCYFVTFEEHSDKGRELVVACCEGQGAKEATTVLYQLAKAKNYRSIRFHTKRKGLGRLVSHLNFKPVETVYKVEL